jgi:hypothetical protein
MNFFHPDQATRLRLDRQAPIDPHQNPGHGLLDRRSDLSILPSAQLLGHPFETSFKGDRGELHHGGLRVFSHLGQHSSEDDQRLAAEEASG